MSIPPSVRSPRPVLTLVKPVAPETGPVNGATTAPAPDQFSSLAPGQVAQGPLPGTPSTRLPAGTLRGPVAARISQLEGTPQGADASRQTLAGLATHAVASVVAEHAASPTTTPPSRHPLLEGFGEALGLALGVIVTEALAVVPGWNTPVLDNQGVPVGSVEGATRVGNHDILKRHQEVVGPQVTALVNKLSPGVIHDLLEGLGKGATEAPGASYRLEASISDALHKR